MSSGRDTVTRYFVVVGGVVLTGLVLLAPWRIWVPLLLIAAATVGVVLVKAASGKARSPFPDTGFTYAHPPPVMSKEKRVSDIPLPSSREDYYFLFSATVSWSPVSLEDQESQANMAGVAVDAILKRAQIVTGQREPEQFPMVQYELAGALGEFNPDPTGRIRVMAQSVRLALPEDDLHRLEKLAGVRKEKALWEHARKYEQSKREYLGEDVLKDTGSAVVWWLSRNDDQVEKTVQDIPLLARLSCAANNKDGPDSYHQWEPQPEFPYGQSHAHSGLNGSQGARNQEGERSPIESLDDLMYSLGFAEGSPQRHLLARRFAEFLQAQGKQAVAEEIRRWFEPGGDGEAPGEAGVGG